MVSESKQQPQESPQRAALLLPTTRSSTTPSKFSKINLLLGFVAVLMVLALQWFDPIPPTINANEKTSEASHVSLNTTTLENINIHSQDYYYLKTIPSSPGNRRLYMDLGANCGNTYGRAKKGGRPGTAETLKLPSPEVWEVYLWECNPQLINWYLLDLVRKEGPDRVLLIPAAASTAIGEATFHLTSGQEGLTKDQMPNAECDPDSIYQPGGASTLYSTAKRAGKSITVPTFDFFSWHRGLNLTFGDVVHMKLDIEGAELDILELFLADETNQMCYWHIFWMEYHKEIFRSGTDDYKKHDEFAKTFPKLFQEKCNRTLWPNVYLR